MILNNGDTGLVHSTKCTDGDIFRKFTWLGFMYSCFTAGVSDQFRKIQEFYKAKVEAFKVWNSYKTWHEITRLSAPAQISHILLKVWLCWSRLRAVWWLVDTGYLFRWFPTAVSWSRTLPGPSRCPGSFSPRPCNKTSFEPRPWRVTRDSWHVTADTWHSVTSRLFAASPKVSRGQNDSSRQRCDKQLVVRERGDITITITFGAEGLLWRFEVSQTECQNILSTKTTFQTWFSLLRHGHKTSISTEAR